MSVFTEWNGDEIERRARRAVGRSIVGIGEMISAEAKGIVHVITGDLRRSIHAAVPATMGERTATPSNVLTGDGAIIEVGSWLDYACLPAGTLVTMEDSTVRDIAFVRMGDRVRTHCGRSQPVTAISRRPAQECVQIQRVGSSIPLYCTPEHRIPTYRFGEQRVEGRRQQGPVGDVVWREAGSLTTDHYLIECPALAEVDRDVLDFRQFFRIRTGRVGAGYLHRKTTDWAAAIDTDFMRLCGYYLAEGCTNKRAVRFTFHEDETSYIFDVTNLMQHYFGAGQPTFQRIAGNKAVTLAFGSSRAVLALNEFGTHAKLKHIPQWAAELPVRKQLGLLDGHFRGDGCYTGREFVVSSASRSLAEGLRLMYQRAGVVPGLHLDQRAVRLPGGELFERELFKLSVSGGHAHRMAKLFNADAPVCSHRNAARHYGGDVVYRVKDVAFAPTNEFVYDLTVDEDHSFIADGVTVSNCVEETGRGHQYMQPAFTMVMGGPHMVTIRAAFREEGF